MSLVLAVLGFVDLVFSPGGVQTFRWLLLALVAGSRGCHGRHAATTIQRAPSPSPTRAG